MKTLDNLTAPPEGERACRHLVDMKMTLDQALEKVKEESPQACYPRGENRIKPIVMSRLSRGGKTTVVCKLFEELKKLEDFCPIFISFNGNAHFRRRDDETHEHAILCRIAVQFTEETDDYNLDVDKDTLLDYINTQSEGRNVVLIIDELNVLNATLDDSAADLLRSEFLDKANQYLVITTHIPMNVDATCSATFLGKRSAGRRSAGGSSSSDRGVHAIHMPLSVDLEKLRRMSNECSALTPFEAVFYGGIPSVIYSIKGNQFSPLERVEAFIGQSRRSDIPVENFLKRVLTGRGHAEISVFDRFGTAEGPGKIQFPLCYINALLVTWFEKKCFSSLYDEIAIYGAKVETGLDWETLVQYAVMMRCVYSSKCSDDKGPFDIVPAGECPEFRFIPVPGECETVDSLIEFVKGELIDCREPILVMVNSQFARFPAFDGFVWYYNPSSSKKTRHSIVGYQCKLGKMGTYWDVPDSISKGVLIRGLPAGSTFRKHKWEYFSEAQVKDFVGFSLQPLIPATWPKVE